MADTVQPEWRSPLIKDIVKGDCRKINDMINIVYRSSRVDSSTILMILIAIATARIDVVKMLCQRWIYIVDHQALVLAIQCGHIDIIEYLVTLDATIHSDCVYYAIISDNSKIIDAMMPHIDKISIEKYPEDDFKHLSPKAIRAFVHAGGWVADLNPRDYLFEISEKHANHPVISRRSSKIGRPTAFSDIVVMC